jgi:hypothetical protein
LNGQSPFRVLFRNIPKEKGIVKKSKKVIDKRKKFVYNGLNNAFDGEKSQVVLLAESHCWVRDGRKHLR